MMSASKEQLADVIEAVRKINNDYEQMKDEEIVEKLLSDEINFCEILKRLDKQFPEICMAAITKDDWDFLSGGKYTLSVTTGRTIDHVKEQTPEMCLAAVKQDGHALEYVREQTPEICMAAIKQNSNALQYVKDERLRKELRKEICEQVPVQWFAPAGLLERTQRKEQ
jgi:hypothetical protein